MKNKRRKVVDGKFVLTKQPRMNHGSLYITEKELDVYYKEIKRSSKWFKKKYILSSFVWYHSF